MGKKPKVGDIVLVGYQTSDYGPNEVQPHPAIVVRVHDPENPESDLDLTIFHSNICQPTAAGNCKVPHSRKLKVDMWSWSPDDAPPAP